MTQIKYFVNVNGHTRGIALWRDSFYGAQFADPWEEVYVWATNVLLVTADPEELLCVFSAEPRNKVAAVESGQEALTWIAKNSPPDLVLLDIDLPGMDGLETLVLLLESNCHSPVLMLSSGASDMRRIVTAIRLGAADYLVKSNDGEHMRSALREFIDRYGPAQSSDDTKVETLQDGSVFVMASPSMITLRNNLEQVARTDFPVLCLGESGAGKEVVARLIHSLSPRSNRRFEKVNCAAMPSGLLESELFGYERGAFTGAVRSKPGRFELCNKGTIFLDEIAEMPSETQAKLLHVLQDHEFHRLGGSAKVRVDVRVIAATNVDVHQAIAAKRFRDDLYYRLNTFVFHLPPLRDRREDIPALLRHFLRRHASPSRISAPAISQMALSHCMAHSWPGNVRELENFAKRYLVLGDAAVTDHRWHLSNWSGASAGKSSDAELADGENLKGHIRELREGAEAEAIAAALRRTRWNRKSAASLLQISYKSLLLKIRQYGLDERNPIEALDLPGVRDHWRRTMASGAHE